jgi:hypothetical protein
VATIICPRCHAEVAAAVHQCPGCGCTLQFQQPAAPAPSPQRPATRLLERPWVVTILVLHLGAFGIPLYWHLRLSLRARCWIIGLSILYTLLVVLIVVWALMQIMKAVHELRVGS